MERETEAEMTVETERAQVRALRVFCGSIVEDSES